MFLMRADALGGEVGPKFGPTSPLNASARIKKHYMLGRINLWCIGGFMNMIYTDPQQGYIHLTKTTIKIACKK